MKQGLTEIVFILDRSGSMSGLEAETIGGFNSTIKKQKAEPGEAIVSTVLFDNEMKVLHDRVPIDQIAELTEQDYCPRGSTALLDAVGLAIHHIGNVHKYARDEDRPEKTIFIITTDGYENASRLYTAKDVKEKVERQKNKYGWEFLFFGANIDAVETARRYGISEECSANFKADEIGVAMCSNAQSMAVSNIRRGRKSREWKEQVENDLQKRSR